MKKLSLIIIILACLPLFSCEDEGLITDLGFEKAEIISRDVSLWVCGGGWFIATETDTVTVPKIPNQEILEKLQETGFDVNPPLKVFVVFETSPEGTCAQEFDRVKEIRDIQLRED